MSFEPVAAAVDVVRYRIADAIGGFGIEYNMGYVEYNHSTRSRYVFYATLDAIAGPMALQNFDAIARMATWAHRWIVPDIGMIEINE